jgi:hypothetical protein
MSGHPLTKEERVLRVLKMVLTTVVKETAAPPGSPHPLSESTIRELRKCLGLIADREKELAEASGRSMNLRPRYVDEPRARGPVVIPLHRTGLARKKRNPDSD